MRTSALARLIVMAVLVFALMFPWMTIYVLVSERTSRRDEAARTVSGEWGRAQTLGGPVLTIPYRVLWKDGGGSAVERTERLFVLPELLTIEGVVEPAIRERGLFEVVVYTAQLKVSGRFAPPDMSALRPAPLHVDWTTATLDVGVLDPRGIGSRITLRWQSREVAFVPGVTANGLFTAGLRANVGAPPEDGSPIPFEFDIALNGTRELRFLPGGDETIVRLTSPWPHPSLTGAPLPRERSHDASGFRATWTVPYFGRGYPARWTSADVPRDQQRPDVDASAFGVVLLQPVDVYQQTERAVKYAILFIVLTFVIAFLWEVAGRVLIHPVQYLFIGFAMCLFYLLLLSLSEHMGFDLAYATASAGTIGLLAWYSSWVLQGRSEGALMGAALAVLYGFLYLLLRLEDYALLAGSIGLFGMLALVMFLTRRINWYELKLGVRNGAP